MITPFGDGVAERPHRMPTPKPIPPEIGQPYPVDPQIPTYLPVHDDLNSTVRFIYSRRMVGIVPIWVEALRAYHPHLQVQTSVAASTAASPALVGDEADLAVIGREMLWAEQDRFSRHFGGPPRRFPVCGGNLDIPGTTHAVAVFVNASNPLRSLTLAQLDAIYSTTCRRGHPPVETWGDLGLRGKWASRKIKRWGQSPDVGFDRFVQERVLLGGDYRADIHLLDQVDTIPERVAEDPSAIGYAGFGHGYDVLDARAVALAVADDVAAVSCSRETVATQEYPLSRLLYAFVPGTGGQALQPGVSELLRFILSREGQQAVSDDSLFFPLPPSVVIPARQQLDRLRTTRTE